MAEDPVARATRLACDRCWEAALAVDASPTSADMLKTHAMCLNRLARHAEAAAAAQKAIDAGGDALAYAHLAEALLHLKRYDEGRAAIAALRAGGPAIWGDHPPGALFAVLETMAARDPHAPTTVAAAAVAPSPGVAAATTSSTEGAAAAAAAAGASSSSSKPPYDWYQSHSHVTITFAVRGADETASRIAVTGNALDVDFALKPPATAAGGERPPPFKRRLVLFGGVQRGIFSAIYKSKSVEVRLTKDTGSSGGTGMWHQLEAPEATSAATTTTAAPAAAAAAGGASAPAEVARSLPAAASAPPVAAAPAAASAAPSASSSSSAAPALPSAYASRKDWSAVERAIAADEDEKVEGEAALQKLFRDIFAKGDEETRRAMNKSFQMSGGTVLSTNWKDVQKRDFEKERVAPEGQVMKKWGEE